MKISKHWNYDYQNKCDCSDDDNCGCSYPENMQRNYSSCVAEQEMPKTNAKTNAKTNVNK